jgi:hypothetical protein
MKTVTLSRNPIQILSLGLKMKIMDGVVTLELRKIIVTD